ncbi:MAG TPA: protein kinase [Gemmatimonadales bacterium]|nr:protein kinase [Gemmatimonadales bacterium]
MTGTVDQLSIALSERYRIRRELGRGGMAVVYLADDLRHERPVAIKVLLREIALALGADRFLHEIRTTAGLSHPHILPLHDSGDAGGLLYYVMPFVDGESLRQRMRREGKLPLADALRITREVGDALGYAHQRQVIHRDIKPENILLADGHAYVADFGIARAVRRARDTRLTRTGMRVGTPAYMSPEQALGEEEVDGRSDLYSLACVVYEMLSGELPWTGVTPEAMLVQRFTSHPSRLSSVRPDLPAGLDDALQKALAREAVDRFPGVADFLAVLESGPPVEAPAGPRAAVPPARAPVRQTVGREKERAELRSAFESARTGRGLLFSVAGEPGIGKTTLVEECLSELAATGQATITRGRCSERLAGTEAYLPLLEALDALLRSEGPAVARALRELAPTWYAQVATQEDSGERAVLEREVQAASPERMKRELGSFVEAVSKSRPLVLLVEDLHWADVSTIDLLGYLTGRLAGAAVLIVVTCRPSDLLLANHPFLRIKPDLQSRGLCRELELAFLTREDIAAYLDLAFPGHGFPPGLPALILAKTEGSPLFMVDLLRYLRDREVIRAGASAPDGSPGWVLAEAMPDLERALPESVRGMIVRKIAQLDDEGRRLLVAASVQGYEFDSAVVARALELEALDVEASLERLERVHALVRLVEERELPNRVPSLRYRFVHVLYQNALYATLRATRRTHMHTAVATALESLYGEKTGGVAQELALLWEGAREPARAARYLLVAAKQAFEVHAHRESAALAARGLELLETLPESRDRDRRELALQVAAGAALRLTRGYGGTEVGKAYRRAALLSERARDDRYLVLILRGLWEYHELRAEYGVALDFAKQLFTFADRRRNPSLLLVAHDALGDTNLWMGELRAARRHLERGVALYDRERFESDATLYGYDSGQACLSFLSLTLWYLGFPDQARRRADEALALARELGRPAGIAQTMFFTAWVHQLLGDWSTSLAGAEELISLSDDHGLPMYSAAGRLLQGELRVGQGRAEEGLALMREGIAGHRASGTELGASVWSGGWLAEGLLSAGATAEAARLVDEALAFVERTGERFHEAELWRLKALALRQTGAAGDDEVAGVLRQAIAAAGRQGARSLELRAVMDLARLSEGEAGTARAELKRVHDWFREGFETADLREARRLLDTGR